VEQVLYLMLVVVVLPQALYPQLRRRRQKMRLMRQLWRVKRQRHSLSAGLRQLPRQQRVVRLRNQKQKTLKQPALKGWNYRKVIREEEMSLISMEGQPAHAWEFLWTEVLVFLVLLLERQVYQRQHWQWLLVERQHLLLLLVEPSAH
jgi:hypothetical protein